MIRAIVISMATLAASSTMSAGLILYGGLGGHSISSGPGASANDGAVATIDQATGAITIVGYPAGVARLSGLAFDSAGALFGSTQGAGGFPPPPGPTTSSQLVRLNPANGSLVSQVPIVAGGTPISIADLAVQPGSDALFGIRGPNDQLGGKGSCTPSTKQLAPPRSWVIPAFSSGALHSRPTEHCISPPPTWTLTRGLS